MTEVPEHLLKRSRDRRAALGLGGGDAGDAAPAPAADAGGASTPAPAAASPATPAPVVESAPKPPPFVPPFVQASNRRKRIPLWVMPVIAFLPVWGVLYAQTLSQPPVTTVSQLQAGAAVFAAKCASCHGPTGGGGAGRALVDGDVLATFPNIVNQLEWINLGSQGYPGGYGNPQREGGQRQSLSFGNMPGFHAALKPAEVLEAARHERETIDGEEGDDVNVDPTGALLWPNGKPFLNSSGILVFDDGEPMFDADGKLTKPVDASKTLSEQFPG